MQPQYAAPNKIKAPIEIYDRYGANPIKLEIYVEQTGFDYIKETFEYHIVAQQEIPGFRYHKTGFVTRANIYSVLAAVVKKIGGLE